VSNKHTDMPIEYIIIYPKIEFKTE